MLKFIELTEVLTGDKFVVNASCIVRLHDDASKEATEVLLLRGDALFVRECADQIRDAVSS